MNDPTDVHFFFRLMTELAAAKRSDDHGRIWEALDDIDVFVMHTGPSPLRTRAALEVSRNGFVRTI